MVYVIKYQVKAYLKEAKMRMATQTYEALDKKIEQLLDAAVLRARKNKKLTVRPYDL